MRPKIKELQVKLETEISKAAVISDATKTEADSLNKATQASPSASGDRYHAENQAELNQILLQSLVTFKQELDEEILSNTPMFVRPITFIKAVINGQEKEFYLVNNPVKVEANFVSINSPVGMALHGRKVGEEFEFGEEPKISGKIIDIG